MYLGCDFRGVWRDTRVPLVLHCIDLIYRSHLLLLCLLTHLQSSIRCRCIGVSVAAFLHKGLSRCRQELAVLSLLLLKRGLLAIYAKWANGQGLLPVWVFFSGLCQLGWEVWQGWRNRSVRGEGGGRRLQSFVISLISSQQGLGPAIDVLCVWRNRGLLYLNFPSTKAWSIFVQCLEAYKNKKTGGRKVKFHLPLLLLRRNEVISSLSLFPLALAVSHLLHTAGKIPPFLQTQHIPVCFLQQRTSSPDLI